MSLMKKMAKMLQEDSRSTKKAQPMRKQIKKLAKSVDDLPNLFSEINAIENGTANASDMTFSDAASVAQEIQELANSCTPEAQGEDLCNALAELSQDMNGYQQFGNADDFDAEAFVESITDSVKNAEQAYNNYKATKTASSFFGIKRKATKSMRKKAGIDQAKQQINEFSQKVEELRAFAEKIFQDNSQPNNGMKDPAHSYTKDFNNGVKPILSQLQDQVEVALMFLEDN